LSTAGARSGGAIRRLTKEKKMNNKTFFAAVMFAAVTLSACSTNPTKQEIGTATGAVVGGVAGAVLTGGSTVGTVGGAAIGGVVGNKIGHDLQNRR
jgi:osmotically inducible lipoprotein OsmB